MHAWCPWRSEGVRSPEAEAAGSYEPSGADAGNQTAKECSLLNAEPSRSSVRHSCLLAYLGLDSLRQNFDMYPKLILNS